MKTSIQCRCLFILSDKQMEEPGILWTIICWIIAVALVLGGIMRFGHFWYSIYQRIKDLFTKGD